MKSLFSVSAIVSVLLCAGRAAELGDPAPELNIAKWTKGEEVQISADPKNIYVVEFWATWCPPCRTSIPHLTEIQRRFKDKNVVIIGVTDEKESVVAPFVKNMGAKMDYRVAIDEDRKTGAGYMGAYGINGIPHAFIVREKKVIWHGHPMMGLDSTLEEVVAGNYDLAKTRSKLKAEGLIEKFREAVATENDTTADATAKEILAAIKDGELQMEFNPAAEKKEIRGMVLRNTYRAAVFRGQDEQAEEIGRKLKEADPTADLNALRKEALVRKDVMAYFQAISSEESSADHKKLGADLAGKVKGEAELGNNIAWAILTDESVKQRDIPLAAQIAKQAAEDSEWKQAHIIDTYSRALFDLGKKDEAVKNQEKAVQVANETDKAQLERTLKAYKEGKLPNAE